MTEVSTSNKRPAKALVWKGLPYRGAVPDLKKADFAPVLAREVHVDVFELDSPEACKRYEQICQKCVDTHAEIYAEDRRYIEEKQQYKVLLKWADLFYRAPNEYDMSSDYAERLGM